MQLADLHNALIADLQQGDFVGPMKKFYADDIVMRTNEEPPVQGRDTLVAAESAYVEGVTAFHGVNVLNTAIDDRGDGNGTVFYEVEMHWEHTGTPKVDIRQMVVEHWRAGKISEIRFYGDITL